MDADPALTSVVAAATDAIERIRQDRWNAQSALVTFSDLQKAVHQLYAYVEKNPQQLTALKEISPQFIPSVFDVLLSALSRPFGRLPGVQRACEAINTDLIGIEQMKQARAAARLK